MKTHTIRNRRNNPIVTLSPEFMQKMLAAYPEAVSLVLAKFRKDYAGLTGQKVSLDHEQYVIFMQQWSADDNGQWISKFSSLPPLAFHAKNIFIHGFMRQEPMRLDEGLEIANKFFLMLDEKSGG